MVPTNRGETTWLARRLLPLSHYSIRDCQLSPALLSVREIECFGSLWNAIARQSHGIFCVPNLLCMLLTINFHPFTFSGFYIIIIIIIIIIDIVVLRY